MHKLFNVQLLFQWKPKQVDTAECCPLTKNIEKVQKETLGLATAEEISVDAAAVAVW